MKENEWVKIEDSLPKIGVNVQLKFTDMTESTGTLEYFKYKNGLSFGCWNLSSITHWRYPTEKPLDFSKLKRGDLIIIENVDKSNDVCAYFKELIDSKIFVDPYRELDSDHSFHRYKQTTKKITRINLEEQKFEEI